jgi:L-iditol 2-dehydrogenase
MNEMQPTMNAGVLYGPGDLRFERVPMPQATPGEALVKIRANGICGSDIHFFESGRLGPFVVDQPYIPGHEAVGEIAAIGAATGGAAVDGDVSAEAVSLPIGQRVVIEPGVPCRRCGFCKRGLYNLCRDVVFLSAPPVNGTFCEYLAHPVDFLFPVPDELSDDEAALVEPVSVGIHACNRAALAPGASVAIVGAGPIGLITLLVAKAYGAGACVVIDLDENRLATARALGAETTIRVANETDTISAVLDATSGLGVSYVFDASGSSAGCALSVRIAAPAGVVTIIGWPEVGAFEYPVELIIERELDVRGINRYRNTYPTAIELMSQRKIDVSSLVSHRYPFANLVEAIEFASTHRSETVKVLVTNE